MDKEIIFEKTDKPIKGGVLLPHLIKLRGRKCECCHNTLWLNQPINLQVHHIDGDRTNNEWNNWQLLCLNCHSYTDNFGSKNTKRKEYVTDEELQIALENNSSIRQALLSLNMSDAGGNYTRIRHLVNEKNVVIGKNLNIQHKIQENYCEKCGKMITPSSTYCTKCLGLVNRTVERPTREELKNLIRTVPFITIGKQFGVSDNAIRKWCKIENLPYTKKEIKSYSDKEWDLI